MLALRLSMLKSVKDYFSMQRADALATSWHQLRQHPEVIEDLVHLGHLFEDPLIDPGTGAVYPHEELIIRATRKALVLQLLARAEITHDELNLIRQQGDTGDETVFDFDDGTLGDPGDQLGAE
ncbi:hypothetical protein [Roseobacter sp.]|uniref:hypothetical protein n=1 Tax=Roseobacter sp. TaxID=1907202 RepID=UPI00296673BF|nr:hypothetical protein [Roseobacter sp.]MDW3181769.1 hypothetical protein [Roseobacter sp.]